MWIFSAILIISEVRIFIKVTSALVCMIDLIVCWVILTLFKSVNWSLYSCLRELHMCSLCLISSSTEFYFDKDFVTKIACFNDQPHLCDETSTLMRVSVEFSDSGFWWSSDEDEFCSNVISESELWSWWALSLSSDCDEFSSEFSASELFVIFCSECFS